MNNPKFSIVIPVYNAEKYLDQCLGSLVNQTLNDIEIICVDDCSTDNSKKVINDFIKKDKRIKYFALSENSGSGHARNIGMEKAQGEYISFVDSDDHIIDNEVYEKIYKYGSKNDADIISSNLKAFNAKGEYFKNLKCPLIVEELPISPQEYGIPWYHIKNVYKNAFLKEYDIKYPDNKRGQDPIFLAKVLKNVDLVYCTPIDFYAYRTFESFDKLNSKEKELDYIKHFREVLDILDTDEFKETHLKYKEKMYEFFKSPDLYFSIESLEENIKTVFGEDSDVYTIFKLQNSLIKKENEIEQLSSSGINSYMESNEMLYIIDSILLSEGNKVNLQIDHRELNFQIKCVVEDIYESSYHRNNSISTRKKFLSKLSSLYVLFNRNNKGIKNAWINFKGYKLIKDNKLFDLGYYLRKNPDVRKSGKDPLVHYMFKGFKEGRNPNSSFNNDNYLNQNPDIKDLNLSPLVHYTLYGQKEKRKIMGDQEIKVKSINPVYSVLDMKTVIEVTFNKPIKAGTQWIELRKKNDELIPYEIQLFKNRINIIPSEMLSESEQYNLIFHTESFTDTFNNPLRLYTTNFSIKNKSEPLEAKTIQKSAQNDSYNNYIQGSEILRMQNNEFNNDKSIDNPEITKLINSNKLVVHPEVYMYISDESNLILNSRLEIGRTYEGRPYDITSLRMFENATLTVQKDFKINTGANITLYPGAKLQLGSGYANNNLKIDCNTTITIGDHVFIASDVVIKDGDGHVINNNPEKKVQTHQDRR